MSADRLPRGDTTERVYHLEDAEMAKAGLPSCLPPSDTGYICSRSGWWHIRLSASSDIYMYFKLPPGVRIPQAHAEGRA